MTSYWDPAEAMECWISEKLAAFIIWLGGLYMKNRIEKSAKNQSGTDGNFSL